MKYENISVLNLINRLFFCYFHSKLCNHFKGDIDNDEEIRVLEEEILELQEYNAKVESEMIKLRTDITQMEQHIRMTERVSKSLLFIYLFAIIQACLMSLLVFSNM